MADIKTLSKNLGLSCLKDIIKVDPGLVGSFRSVGILKMSSIQTSPSVWLPFVQPIARLSETTAYFSLRRRKRGWALIRKNTVLLLFLITPFLKITFKV